MQQEPVEKSMRITFEFDDGSEVVYTAVDNADAWDLVRLVDGKPFDIKSAWRDEEPWFGHCTATGEIYD